MCQTITLLNKVLMYFSFANEQAVTQFLGWRCLHSGLRMAKDSTCRVEHVLWRCKPKSHRSAVPTRNRNSLQMCSQVCLLWCPVICKQVYIWLGVWLVLNLEDVWVTPSSCETVKDLQFDVAPVEMWQRVGCWVVHGVWVVNAILGYGREGISLSLIESVRRKLLIIYLKAWLL